MPQWLTFVSAVSGAVGGAITGPLLMIVLVLCYYDSRIRKEAFDLQFMMSSLDHPTPAGYAFSGLRTPPLCGRSAATPHIALVALLTDPGLSQVALWSRPAPPQAPNQPLSLQEYIAELRTASDALDGRNPATISAFRRPLPAEWVVQVDQQSMKVETDWLAAALLIEENEPGGKPSQAAASAAEGGRTSRSRRGYSRCRPPAPICNNRGCVSMAFCATVSFRARTSHLGWISSSRGCTPGFHAF